MKLYTYIPDKKYIENVIIFDILLLIATVISVVLKLKVIIPIILASILLIGILMDYKRIINTYKEYKQHKNNTETKVKGKVTDMVHIQGKKPYWKIYVKFSEKYRDEQEKKINQYLIKDKMELNKHITYQFSMFEFSDKISKVEKIEKE